MFFILFVSCLCCVHAEAPRGNFGLDIWIAPPFRKRDPANCFFFDRARKLGPIGRTCTGWREVWMGGDAMRDVWLIYTGVTLAPWSEHVYDPGWRLRAHSGYGEFKDDYETFNGIKHYTGAVTYIDALVGYHWRIGELTAKAFAGISVIDRKGAGDIPTQIGRDVFTTEYGPKVMLELWYNIDSTQWTSLNLSFTTAHTTASARWRYGFKPWPGLSIGPELRFDSNDLRSNDGGGFFDSYLARGGAFASYKWEEGIELSIAGGIGTHFRGIGHDPGDSSITPYGTVNVLFQF